MNSRLRLVTLIKSILLHTSHSVHFHVVTNSRHSIDVFENLFATWALPQVKFSVYDYNRSGTIEEVAWIPNRHYSGLFGLTKLVLTEILPRNIDKILVLDSDVLVLTDLADLWSLFQRFNSTQTFGLVENLSNWYLHPSLPNNTRWPALERGFNTGVILMKLEQLRLQGWVGIFKAIVTSHLTSLAALQLADQDVLNAVIKSYPKMHYTLPCAYNFQIHNEAREDLCNVSHKQVKIVHWNSYGKQQVEPSLDGYFEKMYDAYSELDGGMLRYKTFGCSNGQPTELFTKADKKKNDQWIVCSEFRTATLVKHRVHMFCTEFDYEPVLYDVTLVTQLSFDRMSVLRLLLQYWSGPLAVSMYLTDAELHHLEDYFNKLQLGGRKNVAVHVVFKDGVALKPAWTKSSNSVLDTDTPFYPINKLRNIALRSVRTAFVFLCDVDFIPMMGAYELLKKAIQDQGSMERTALIVPAFEMNRLDGKFPLNKTKLQELYMKGEIAIFGRDKWNKGHVATDYDRWMTADSPYKASFLAYSVSRFTSALFSMDFEPYFVVSTNVSAYDERFVGFGWNKVSHVMQLDAEGQVGIAKKDYQFYVLPNVFAVHYPHAASFENSRFQTSSLYRRCLTLLKGEFMKDLAKQRLREKV
ncbi:glycosyltransferase protein LARGE2 like [Trichuris trichiura]|uniref:Glycosyltransferase protein LARGE2 like n=1 Tax=Trichuris trichiura TaxID=36087 RepID=A0A077ZJ64_TRITR|nr:glycosyltransferase protein LARGE2 like [Trichuris trichiura]